ncbi:MAG: GIY-YIG nuclease family protein [Candidatus Glassbacteria bacterium]|nr:GIY-YIG nuclease family protein [Candidatus Glassbacteria bacterium]
MAFFVYILESQSSSRYYIGHTDELNRRLAEHNDPLYKGSKTTKRFAGPWVIVYSETFDSRSQAVLRERQIKSWKSRSAIHELIESSR